MKCKWVLLLILVFVTGCAGEGVVQTTYYGSPEPDEIRSEPFTPIDVDGIQIVDGDVITKVVTETKDASIAKEQAVHKTLQNRDKMRVEAAKVSGFKMDWTKVDKTIMVGDSDGKVTEIVMTEYLPNVSYVPLVAFEGDLPTQPSRHPAWDTANQFIKTTGYVTLGIVGINAISDMWEAGLAGAAANFGDNASVYGSYNTTGGDMQTGDFIRQRYDGDYEQIGGDYNALPEKKE